MNTDKSLPQSNLLFDKTSKVVSGKKKFPGYPPYPPGEDIFISSVEESELDPEDISKLKQPNELPGNPNEKDFTEVFTGIDLDVPGSELDDTQEDLGSEDEENNYYSIGGDNHDDLEERKEDTLKRD
jgi:hypothetical protein